MKSTSPAPWRRLHWVVAALSFALNLAGASWGLPARWHPDEKADVVAAMVQTGSVAPGSFINPTLSLYVALPLVWVQDRLARNGVVAGLAADPLAAARLLAAVAGAVATFVLAGMNTRLGPGLLPAAFFLVAPVVVNLCHFATPEPWLLLGTVVVLRLAVNHLEGGAPAWAVGLAVGLTTSTKYTAAALLVPALAAAWLRPPEAGERDGRWAMAALAGLGLATGGWLLSDAGGTFARGLRLPDARLLLPEHAQGFVRSLGVTALLSALALAGAVALASTRAAWTHFGRRSVVSVMLAAAVGFVAGSPFVLVRPTAFLSDLAFNHQTRFEYKGLVGEPTSYAAYLGLLDAGLSGPLFGAALLGGVVALLRGLRGDRTALVVLLAAAAPFFLLAASGHRALRFVVPIVPPAAWLAALCLTSLPSPRMGRLLAGLVFVRAALAAVLVVRLFYVDSRRLAEEWMAANVPRGATVDLIANHEGYAPRPPAGRTLRLMRTLSREMAPPERFVEAAARFPSEAAPWVVVTAAYYQRFLDHPDQRPARAAFFRNLLDGRLGFEVAARFQQRGWLRPPAEFLDPEIVILKKVGHP